MINNSCRSQIGLFATLLMLLSACNPSSVTPAAAVAGRWQKTGQSDIFEPNSFAEDIELRADGQWVILLWDQIPDQYWTIDVSRYSLPANDQIKVTGWCWTGYERFECTREFSFTVGAGILRIFNEQGRSIIYRRVADAGPELPPTLAPPFATPGAAP